MGVCSDRWFLFRSLLVNIGKDIVYVMYVISTPVLLPPFAGCQSALSQNMTSNRKYLKLTLPV